MATTLIVRKICDVCQQTSDEDDGTIATIPWSWDGTQYELDACAGCKDTTNMSLAGIVNISRQTSKPKRKSPDVVRGNFPCRDKKCDRSFETVQGRGRHETSMHPKAAK